MIIDNLYNGATSFLPSMRKVMVFFTFMCAFSMAYPQTYYLHVGEAKFLGIPNTNYVVEGSASWGCTHRQIDASTDDKESGVIITIKQYFSDAATISVTWTEEYFNTQTGHSQFTARGHTWTIRCKPVNINLAESNIEMKPGDTKRLNYSWSDPSWASAAQVEWVSSDPSIATVEGSSSSITKYATITAKKSGNVTITANTNMGPSAVCNVTVKAVEPNSVSLPSTAWTKVGESVKLSPTLYPSNAQTTYTWSSDNTNVATVSQNGLVNGKKTGTANITVKTANGKTATCRVTVEKGDLTLSCNTESGLIAKGTKVTLTASRSDAEIYYTLDGSTPTSNSNRYTGSITINEALTLKAIATGSEYNTSSVLTRVIQVTSLDVNDMIPVNKTSNKNIIPTVMFNDIITAGKYFNEISLTDDNSNKIDGEVFILDKTLCFVPSQSLSKGRYTLFIPESALLNTNKEPNIMLSNTFDMITKIIGIAVGLDTSFAILSNGSLWAWGNNDYYQLGIGNKQNQNRPVKVMDNVISVAAGYKHTLALKTDHTVWGCGRNMYGSVGDGTYFDKKAFVKVMNRVNIINSCFNTSLAIDYNNVLWGWGFENSNQLLGNGVSVIPIELMNNVLFAVLCHVNLVLKKDHSLWEWDGTSNGSTPAKKMENVMSMASNWGDARYAIKTDGTLWTWGWGQYGMLGNGSTTGDHEPQKIMDNTAQISSIQYHALAVRKNKELYAWGANWDGQLGDGSTTNSSVPIWIMDGVVDAVAGEAHSLALKEDGTLWSWGKNDKGQLGTGNNVDSNVPIQIPLQFFNINPVSAVDFGQENYSIKVNEKTVLIPKLTPSDAEYETIAFSSSNTDVASVTDHGVLSAKQLGSTVVTVTVDDLFTATCKVTVEESTGINEVESKRTADGHIYSLSGQRLAAPKKGINIINGRKVIVK